MFGLCALSALVVALAQPQWGKIVEETPTQGLDVLIVLDLSSSMEVEDLAPSRLLRARHWIRNFLTQVEGDRVGLVAFAGSSFLAAPLTTDLDYIREQLETLDPRVITNQGTDLGMGISTAVEALERGSEGGSPESRVILVISDGEDLENEAEKAAQSVKEKRFGFFALGIGTEGGGPVPLFDSSGQKMGFKKDESGQPIVSRFTPSALQAVAKAAGGEYWTATDSESEIKAIVGSIEGRSRSSIQSRKQVHYKERYQWFLGIVFLFWILELLTRERVRRQVAWGLLFTLVAVSQVSAQNSRRRSEPNLGAYLKNRDGLRHLQSGNLQEAQKDFVEAQLEDSSQPELIFNEGVAALTAKDPKRAAERFGMAAKLARERGNSRLERESLYNQGVAINQAGDPAGAVRSLSKTLELAEKAADEPLALDLRKQIARLTQSPPKSDKSGGQSNPEESKDSGKDPGKDSQGQDSKQPSEPETAENRKSRQQQQFQSQELSKEDAERVLNALSEKERQLKQALNRNAGRGQSRTKDW